MKAKKHFLQFALFIGITALAWSIVSAATSVEIEGPEQITTSLNLTNEDTIVPQKFPTVLVKNEDGVSKPIRMSDLKISVEIIGNIAQTTMEMVFQNDSNRVLEGQLYFPLGDGQTVSRFAMDVDGKLREGVIVEKNKGQAVFESVIRQKIDPGLLEWTNGNNFKARVYPLEKKKPKRIVVAYEQELKMDGDAFVYNLPLNEEETFDDFSFSLTAHNQKILPISENGDIQRGLEPSNEGYAVSWTKSKYQPEAPISVELPFENDANQIFTEQIQGTNQYYYYIGFPEEKTRGEADKPQTIAMIWDASTSAKNRNSDKEFDFLERYFEWNANVSVNLYILRNNLTVADQSRFEASNFLTIKETLKNLPLDGASAYEQIDYTALVGDAIMILGDGLSNFGVQNLTLPEVPIFSINSSASANHSHLKYLAGSTGGEYLNLSEINAAMALANITQKKFKYFGNKKEESYPSIPTTVNGRVHIAGIIEGTTTVSFEFGTQENRTTKKVTIDPEKHQSNSGLLGRIWAQKKLAELDINFRKNEEAITALGKKHSIVTRNTSLIVLDRLEDYIEHEILPPEELRKEYHAGLDAKWKLKEDQEKEHTDRVKEDFKNYVAWWNTEFDLMKIVEEDKKRQAEQQIEDRDIDRSIRGHQRSREMNTELMEVSAESEELEGSAVHYYANGAFDLDASEALESVPGVSLEENVNKKRVKGKKGKIDLEKWEPDAKYMKTLKDASNNELYKTYLELKKKHSQTPSFFLDASDVFLDRKMNDLALRVLSNIAEFELENHELMRVLAHRLEQLKYYDLAVAMYRDVLKLRQEEPQSYRDLGLCLAKSGQHQEAVSILYEMANKPWDGRFPGIETIALVEMNQIIAANRGSISTDRIDPFFVSDMPTDVRVVLNWDADNCDMDLWVTDPRGEKCFYSHKETTIGGLMSNDFTGGYGPEQFVLKNALKGEYKVEVNYYGTRSQRISGPTTIQVQLITNYGKPNQKVQEVTRRLGESKEVLNIGTFSFQ